MSQFNDLFALSEVCLLADVVQLAVDRGIAFDASALAEDVARAISHVHISGALHDAVRGDPATYLHPIEGFGELLASLRASGTVWKSKFYGAFMLNHRVVLHAIDAMPARWRGDAGSSPLDGASTAASSPRNDLVKNCRVHPTH